MACRSSFAKTTEDILPLRVLLTIHLFRSHSFAGKDGLPSVARLRRAKDGLSHNPNIRNDAWRKRARCRISDTVRRRRPFPLSQRQNRLPLSTDGISVYAAHRLCYVLQDGISNRLWSRCNAGRVLKENGVYMYRT